MVTEFNPITTPIEPGLTLLEAGAGTGKTYSLVRIIARQIVEENIPVEAILAVTFTRAATAEIKSRIHETLSETLRDLRASNGEKMNDLAKHFSSFGPDFVKLACSRIALALTQLDSISVFTIDGFFQRLLKEYAFESHVLFSTELVPDESDFIRTSLQDYWRQHVYSMDAASLASFQSAINFNKALNFINDTQRNPDVILDPAYQQDADNAISHYHEKWNTFIATLLPLRDNLGDFVRNPPIEIAKTSAPFKSGTTDNFLEKVDQFLANPHDPAFDLGYLDRLATPRTCDEKFFKKGKFLDLSKHTLAPLFHAIHELIKARPLNLASAYLGRIHSYVTRRIELLKSNRNMQSYNDITATLAHMLEGESDSSISMKSAVRRRYRAVLIDEFQDTSPQQCSVFLNLFNRGIQSGDARYFHIIGDPKQSIYRFRGADVFSYMKAAEQADRKYHLLTNYRSSPRMIHAVNTLFSRHSDAFLTDGKITFSPSKWPGDEYPSLPDGPPVLYFHEAAKVEYCYDSICTTIRGLLGTQWQHIAPGSEMTGTVTPSDIAILVRSGAEGGKLSELLSDLEIPAALGTRSSLLASHEASEMMNILHALLEPQNSPATRMALLSPSMGSGSLMNHHEALDAVGDIFTELHQLWHSHGLAPAMQRFIQHFHVRETLLALTHGLRRITNFNHLIDLLDGIARSRKLTPYGLLQWLDVSVRREKADVDSEVLELRISTDEAAVQILTQHTSKGLEFPITFVMPPCKNKQNDKRITLHYHAEDGSAHLAPYDDTEGEHFELRRNEDHADAVRLAYVALTRAKYRCHFYHLEPADPSDHPISRMLGSPDKEQLESMTTESSGCIFYQFLEPSGYVKPALFPAEESNCKESLQARDSSDVSISSHIRTTSFTGITRNAPDVTHDRDALPDRNHMPTEGFWKSLVPGAGLGLVFHEILEETDFQDTSDLEILALRKLEKYSPWRNQVEKKDYFTIAEQVANSLRALLIHSITPSLRLSQLTAAQRLNEAEFLLSGGGFSLTRLADVLRADPPACLPRSYVEQLAHLDERSVQGFLDGVIDLIFEHEGRYHILDWKTNQLQDHSSEGLAELMAEHHYFLQYHLYTLALDRLLSQRLGEQYDPAQHLGDCYYIFLRGVDPALPSSGVYHDRITPARLEKLRTAYR